VECGDLSPLLTRAQIGLLKRRQVAALQRARPDFRLEQEIVSKRPPREVVFVIRERRAENPAVRRSCVVAEGGSISPVATLLSYFLRSLSRGVSNHEAAGKYKR
jgi:hypothetical protein